MSKKVYNGYKSFQYLTPERTTRSSSRQGDRPGPSVCRGCHAGAGRTVQDILDKEVVVSLHDHIYIAPEDMSKFFEYQRCGRNWTDMKR